MTLGDSIRVRNGYQSNAYHYPVLIIGAGESGIAMGCRAKEKLGLDQFRILDRQSGIRGRRHRLGFDLVVRSTKLWHLVDYCTQSPGRKRRSSGHPKFSEKGRRQSFQVASAGTKMGMTGILPCTREHSMDYSFGSAVGTRC